MKYRMKRESHSLNRNKIFNQIIAIMGMIAALVVAYGLDRWLIQARKEVAESFILFPVLWGKLAANLIAAAMPGTVR